MKKYPIGIQDFRKIIEGGYVYVDKTRIIHQMISTGNYYFLSRPRRFGKSLMLSTIKEMFLGSKELFKGLWIENNWDWDKRHPVLHFSFSNLGVKTLGLTEAIHQMLLSNAAAQGIELQSSGIELRFRELVQKTSNQLGPVVILIDEYDKPIIDNLGQPEKAEENRSILKQFYSVVKDSDPYIRLFLLTGVSKFSKVSIFSDLNNLEDITLIISYNELLGINQLELEQHFGPELEEIALQQNTEKPALVEKIKDWYNGYNWGGSQRVYNPFSLLSFFKNQQFNNFWFETGTPTFLVELIRQKGDFTLDQDEYTSLLTLSQFEISNLDYKTILFQTGYLTIETINFLEGWCRLRYPNKEVKDSLLQFLLAAYRYTHTGEALPTVLQLKNAFVSNDLEKVVSLINSSFATIPSDLWKGATELHYHALVHLTFSLLGSYIQSEVNSSKGRCDAIVKTGDHIYALEFKLDKSAEAALQQIFDKQYLAPYAHLPQRKVAVGINFSSEQKKVGEYLVKAMRE
ncbi:MAG: AAA family ATPase [Saprospiraceae bacterium]